MNSNLNFETSSTYLLDPERIPIHVAMIMDGNGRWAKKRFLNKINGHEKGVETVRMATRVCREIGISILTLYAFSTENWQRPKSEVVAIMALLKRFLGSEQKEMMDNNIRLNAIGQVNRLPENILDTLNKTIALTKNNDGLLLNLALSYGGRAEIVEMAQKIALKAKNGEIDPASITSETVSNHLYTKNMPDPDLLIRTSGEMRISNFLLWQIAYTEIFVTDTLWPDFSERELLDIFQDYQKRERRFGKTK